MTHTVPASGAADRLLAALLLLPAAWLLLPLPPGPLLGVFDAVEATGAGAAHMAALPAAAFTAWRAWKKPFEPPRALLAFWLVAAVSAALVPGTDSFGRDAALSTIATGGVLALGAASLGPDGRAGLVRGLIVLALLALLPALLGLGDGFTGVVGNTGELSGAALPGAFVGAGLFARGRGVWSWVGLGAAFLFVLHAMLAPVIAALFALAVIAGLVGAFGYLRGARGAGARLVGVAALCLVAFGVSSMTRSAPAPTIEAPLESTLESTAEPGDLGGVGVRAKIWRASFGLVADAPLLGVGPGQFAATFPPHRDPAEIEASTHRRALGADTEVEHPHSDAVLAFTETGLVGGAVWLLLVLVAGFRALRLLGLPDPSLAAAGVATLGVLLASFLNAHLLANPPAGAAAFPLLGLVLARGAGPPPRGVAGRLVPLVALAILLAGVASARDLWAHGRALARLSTEARPSLATLELAVAEALEARPDSVVARALSASMAADVGISERAAIERTRAVLELRPHRVGAWIDLGVRLATSEGVSDIEGARRAFERALELDPRHPVALMNLARLELLEGDGARGLELLDRLATDGRLDATRGLRLGADLLLRGRSTEGTAVLTRVDPRYGATSGELAQALALEFEGRGETLLAEAMKAHAHRLWGLDHAARGDFEQARRSLFQSLRITRDHVEGGAPRVRLEYAAALSLSGAAEEAPRWLAGLEVTATDWNAIAPWARAALLEGELAPQPSQGAFQGAPSHER